MQIQDLNPQTLWSSHGLALLFLAWELLDFIVGPQTWYHEVSSGIFSVTEVNRSRDSSVSVVIRPQAGRPRNRGLIPGRVKKPFSSPTCLDRPWSRPSLSFSGYQGVFPRGVKRPQHGIDHLPSLLQILSAAVIPFYRICTWLVDLYPHLYTSNCGIFLNVNCLVPTSLKFVTHNHLSIPYCISLRITFIVNLSHLGFYRKELKRKDLLIFFVTVPTTRTGG